MVKPTIWMVRAGRGGYLFEDFIKNNVVAIGWNRISDISKLTTKNEIKKEAIDAYPELKGGKLNMSASQIGKFRVDFKVGDFVITYDPQNREYWIGEILGDYEYNTKLLEYHHIRRVKWIKGIDRDDLSVPTKNTLGAISTIFELSREARNEIFNLLEGKKIQEEVPEETEEDIKQQTIDKANEFIKDKLSDLDWDEMQELVAGILKSMGYRTRIVPHWS
jgi:restriction system protein